MSGGLAPWGRLTGGSWRESIARGEGTRETRTVTQMALKPRVEDQVDGYQIKKKTDKITVDMSKQEAHAVLMLAQHIIDAMPPDKRQGKVNQMIANMR